MEYLLDREKSNVFMNGHNCNEDSYYFFKWRSSASPILIVEWKSCYHRYTTAMYCITAAEHGVRNYATVFPILTLRQLAEKTPQTVEEMTQTIDGLPKAKVNKYGAERFLEITKTYHLILTSKCTFTGSI
jgi:superfamily II DNA helicase RecQ